MIESTLAPGELAGRLHGSGGDEFLVLCPQTDDETASRRAVELEQRLAPDQIELPDDLRGLYAGASVGHALRSVDESALTFMSAPPAKCGRGNERAKNTHRSGHTYGPRNGEQLHRLPRPERILLAFISADFFQLASADTPTCRRATYPSRCSGGGELSAAG